MNNICGVFHLSSKTILHKTKTGRVFKKFTPDNSIPSLIVSTIKPLQNSDYYAIVKPIKNNDGGEVKYQKGELIDLLGTVGDYGTEKIYLEYRNKVKWKSINKKIISSSLYTEDPDKDVRVDLSNEFVVSIDPEGCIDIDDGIHLSIKDNYYEVGIHIADVSSYIIQNSELDKILEKRVESKYYPWKTYHMLPENIATEICSLRKNKESRVISIIFKFDKNYNLINYKIQKSLIINKRTLSYIKAQRILLKDTQLSKLLNILYKIGKNIMDNKKISDIVSLFGHNEEYDMHKMVEVYMILANVTIANILNTYDKDNCILRSHSGIVNGLTKIDTTSEILREINKYKVSKAKYVTGNSNYKFHCGLQEELYTHFTSPIRRYVDLIVHRMVSNFINKTKYNPYSDQIERCNKINEIQKNIKNASRESYTLKKFYEYYENKDGTLDTDGFIIGFLNNTINIYVPELEMSIRYFVHSDKLKHLYNIETCNEFMNIYFGENNKYVYVLKIGEKKKVRVTFSNKEGKFNKKIQIQLVNYFNHN